MAEFHFSPRPNQASEINWREWGEAAFQEAQGQDKPILLAISAVWCHWCHVQDETTYSDPQVIRMVNERFIPIRVDNDQRPDINRRYNLGGWPTTAFLTPGGELLTGGTYIPPQQMRGYLYQISEAYRQEKEGILQKVGEVERQRAAALTEHTPGAPGGPSGEIVDSVALEVLDNLDTLYGGFGEEPKFPHTDAVELALAKYYQDEKEDFLPVVTITLSKMAQGGIYDQVAGGFFRYSTTRDWSVPHFEKMLEENALLLMVYLHAYQVTGRALFRDTARSLARYVTTTLYDSEAGYFYGSQDADEHYYQLPAEERARLPAPYLDRNLYTDWNALMASALLQAAPVLEDLDLRRSALHSLGTLGETMFRPGEGMFHFRRAGETTPQLAGLLSDQAHTAQAFLDAYEATGRNTYLGRVHILADLALGQLYDRERGGFYTERLRPDAPGLLRLPEKSLPENAAMADVLIQLYRLTGDEKYLEPARKTLAYFASDYTRYSYTAAGYALAVDRLLSYPLQVTVVGDMEDSHAQELLDAARRQYAPARIVELVDPVRDAERLAALGYPVPADGAQAYVCVGQTCLPPIGEPNEIAEAVAAMRKRRTESAA